MLYPELNQEKPNCRLKILFVFLLLIKCPGCSDSSEDVPDGGTDAPCAHGENEGGQGCYLPCEDEWHNGVEGDCHTNCPSILKEDKNGECSIPLCPDGGTGISATFDSEEVVWKGSVCVHGCPPGMNEVGQGLLMNCFMPCEDGWTPGTDGRCHLDCPEGMESSESPSGCSLTDVGENKTCPSGKYDTSFSGPNPLYVDINDSSATQDGTVESPFHSIMDAVNAGGDSITIYVAPGKYNEQVILDSQKEVNLIGSCADNVILAGEGLGSVNEYSSGVINVLNVDSLTIEGFAITSDLRGIRVDHESRGDTVVISDIRIDDAMYIGIGVYGHYDNVSVVNSTVSSAANFGISVIGSWDRDIVDMQAAVSGNRIIDLNECRDLDLCEEDPYIAGILVSYVSDAVVDGNLVSGFEYADAVQVSYAEDIAVDGNIIENIAGSTAIYLLIPDEADVMISNNRVADCEAGPWAGEPAGEMTGVLVAADPGSRDLSALISIHGNFIEQVQGYGIFSHPMSSPPVFTVNVQDNEVSAVPYALYLEGCLEVKGNRVYEAKASLWSGINSYSVEVTGNEFRDGVAHNYDLPPGTLKDALKGYSYPVFLNALNSGSEVVFSGNRISGMTVEIPADGAAVAITELEKLEIEGNCFEQNNCPSLYFGRIREAAIRGNRFKGNSTESTETTASIADSAILSTSFESGEFENVAIEHNYFEAYMNGYAFASDYTGGTGNYRILNNTFILADMIRLSNSFDGSSGLAFVYRNNDHFNTSLQIGPFVDMEIEENRFTGSAVLITDQESGNTARISHNIMQICRMAMVENEGQITIENNEFNKGYAYDLLVASSPGKAVVKHNIFNDITYGSIEGVGEVGDLIQVVGTPEQGISDVEIYDNRIEKSSRFGLMIHGSNAVVEGNMYSDNGSLCGNDCDFIIQSSPGAESVTGWDTSFAVTPDHDYGVITADGPF